MGQATDHNVDLPLADGQVPLVVDAHPLEGQPPPGAVLYQEHDGEPTLGDDVLKDREHVTKTRN